MEFALVMFILPAIVIVTSIIGMLAVKKWFAMPIITFIVFIILTFTVFNETFFIWVVVYTVISLIISLLINLIRR